MDQFAQAVEDNPTLVEMLRFLIAEDALHEEFLITVVIEYFANNRKGSEGNRLGDKLLARMRIAEGDARTPQQEGEGE